MDVAALGLGGFRAVPQPLWGGAVSGPLRSCPATFPKLARSYFAAVPQADAKAIASLLLVALFFCKPYQDKV